VLRCTAELWVTYQTRVGEDMVASTEHALDVRNGASRNQDTIAILRVVVDHDQRVSLD